jgi:5-methylcytosine-specific restriction endonuclease McrA
MDSDVAELQMKLKAIGREWNRDSLFVCLRHKGKCEYCGFDLLSSQGVCYHFWCIDHLLPQALYPELADHIENKILACRSCNSIKADWDPSEGTSIYFRDGHLTSDPRRVFLNRAKEYVRVQRERLERAFDEELKLLKPFIV